MAGGLEFLITGVVLGLAAGVSPGPLLTLVISETLRHGVAQGFKVALAPLITDLPIITLTLFLFYRLSSFDIVLGIISFSGACLLFYLGYECLNPKEPEAVNTGPLSHSLKKGIAANALSPHPYMFWLTIGAPILHKSWSSNPVFPAVFVVTYYLLLVSSKGMVAFLVDKSRAFLSGAYYLWLMRFLGMALMVYGILFVRDGLFHLDVLSK